MNGHVEGLHEIGVRPHRNSLDPICIEAWQQLGSTVVQIARSVAGSAHPRGGRCRFVTGIAVRKREHVDLRLQASFEQCFGMPQLVFLLRLTQRGETPVPDTVRLDGHTLPSQLLEISPVADGFLRLYSLVEGIRKPDKGCRYEDHGWEPEAAQKRQRYLQHRPVPIVECQEHGKFWKALWRCQAC